jgi:hypothetical protein
MSEFDTLRQKIIERIELYIINNHDYKTALQALKFLRELDKDA